MTGAWQHLGGGALYGHTGIYPLDRSLIEGLDVVDSTVRELDQSRLGPILTGDADALNGGPPVTALLVQNTNPAMVCPDLNQVHAGLAREDLFTCVHEQFMTETAAFADIVLPATSFLEHDDFYTASGHTVFQVARKVIEAPGEARENHFVICELAKRLGAEHPGFYMSAWEIMDATLRRSGMWDAQTNHERGGQDFAYAFEKMHFLDGFETKDRKFHFRPDWQRFGGRWQEMPNLPDHMDVIDNATPEKPFRLVAAPGANLPQFNLHRNALLGKARTAADGAHPSAGLFCTRTARRRSRTARQRTRRSDRACEATRWSTARRGGRRRHLAQPLFREWAGHQRADQRGSRVGPRAARHSTTPRCGYAGLNRKPRLDGG